MFWFGREVKDSCFLLFEGGGHRLREKGGRGREGRREGEGEDHGGPRPKSILKAYLLNVCAK